ncbi:hypothetical protein [Staphylococcus shinii]|uniref:hypothetical protein n=1 Tax=Staphylococcus shinii TaxID=2912228 RepID=UPI00298EDC0F|nr:hypothetical protein [Staphylococcus shinii]MDW8563874.1 hypothetical protein [Staphylococcus shinii]
MSSSSSYSKYTDTQAKDFEVIIKKLDAKIDEKNRDENNENLKTIFEEMTSLSKITISDSVYEYKVYRYFHEFINEGFENDSNRESRISVIEAIVVAFSNGETNQFIIDKSNSDSRGKKIIRKLMNYEDKGEIINNQISLLSNKDFYLWLFYMVLNNEGSDEDVTIESIEAYRGNKYIESLTNVSGSGSEVMNLLSTLTFLFEIEEINKVKLNLGFQSHIFSVEFIDSINSNNIRISTADYQGDLDELDIGSFIANITMKVFLEVLPKLSSIYSQSDWDKDAFNKDIGQEVIDRINNELMNVE